MSSRHQSEHVFLQIDFRSPERDGTLRKIELLGVPGERARNGKFVVNQKTRQFFDDLIVRSLFQYSRRLPNCDFQYLKIWLYDTEMPDDEYEYDLPEIDKQDLEIRSNMPISELEYIYVLDNDHLTGSEYQNWRRTAEDLFSPLFRNFITPPERPEIDLPFFNKLADFFDNVTKWTAPIDPYRQVKRGLFFNALIIQID